MFTSQWKIFFAVAKMLPVVGFGNIMYVSSKRDPHTKQEQ